MFAGGSAPIRTAGRVGVVSLVKALAAMPNKVYAGVGSRATPPPVLRLMEDLARKLGWLGFRLRTGGAEGADQAFERGAPFGTVDLFLPWPGFRGASLPLLDKPSEAAYRVAAEAHPGWRNLDNVVRALLARDAHQVLGASMGSPAAFVLCWTRDGATKATTRATGGTGQAIRIAAMHDVPVFNLARLDHRSLWEELLR